VPWSLVRTSGPRLRSRPSAVRLQVSRPVRLPPSVVCGGCANTCMHAVCPHVDEVGFAQVVKQGHVQAVKPSKSATLDLFVGLD